MKYHCRFDPEVMLNMLLVKMREAARLGDAAGCKMLADEAERWREMIADGTTSARDVTVDLPGDMTLDAWAVNFLVEHDQPVPDDPVERAIAASKLLTDQGSRTRQADECR